MSREQSRSGAARGGKRILYLNRRAPHGSIYAHEALEALLMAAGFEQVPSVVFMDDGVYQLKLDQSPRALDMKNFAAAFRSLELYDIEPLYVERESLQARGLSADDLLTAVELVSSEELGVLLEEQDVVLSF